MASNETTLSKAEIYNEIKETAWRLFVFHKKLETEVGYGRLACECPNLGKFLESYTADLGDDEADGYDAEEEDKLAQESSSSEEDEYVTGKKRKKNHGNGKTKAKKTATWRDEQDAVWIKNLVERPDTQFIYQMPHLQTQTVCFGGLTKFRTTVLREFQIAAKLFEYSNPVFSGSPSCILENLQYYAAIPHGLTDQLDPFVWEHYRAPINEALCVYWHYLPLNRFNVIQCGHAPGETFQGATSQMCQENLLKVQSDWRQQLAMATNLCMMDDYDVKIFDNDDIVTNLLTATYPLKLVYVSDTGELRHAKNLEACRAKLMKISNEETKYPMNPQKEDREVDYELECDEIQQKKEEKKLNVQTPPTISELAVTCPKWIEVICSGFGPKLFKFDCELCPESTKKQNVAPKQFSSWQDYVSCNWQHMCDEHGALGANSAFKEVPNWIQNYIWRHADRNLPKLIFTAIAEAGFTECGQNEQGTWKSLSGCKQGLHEALTCYNKKQKN